MSVNRHADVRVIFGPIRTKAIDKWFNDGEVKQNIRVSRQVCTMELGRRTLIE